ncbi:DUF7289 family protein [Halopenitus persicus]|uniref:DUF7289 family protein n=1 Tax=Halopenitus persicus TaxID=1048396 RepID=UPI000BBA5167|nr:hypothetical protein [Halopenitus persicus]
MRDRDRQRCANDRSEHICDRSGHTCDRGEQTHGRGEQTHGRGERTHNRGQSELLGFALIFGVVVLAIVLIGTTGFVGLDDARDFQRTTNAEQALTVLAENIDDVTRRGAPSRTTEIRLADASLSLGEPERITVTVGDSTPENTTDVEMRPIVYDSGSGTTIAYTSGALIRQDGEHSVMIREPNVVLTDELVLLPVVATSPNDAGPVGGTSAVDVRTRSAGTEVVAADDGATTVDVEVTSPRVESWYRFLDGETDADCEAPVDETVTCTIETQRVYVTVEHVDVRFR